MDTSTFTWSLTGFVILAIVIYDVYIILKKGKYESISAHIIRGSKKMPLIVFCAGLLSGILLGHLLWSMDSFDYLERSELISRCKQLLQEGEK